MRGLSWALGALLAVLLSAARVSGQAGTTVIVELSTPPAALQLPSVARQTGAAAAAQRVARLGMASSAATAEQSSFRTAATATGLPIKVLHTYRYVRAPDATLFVITPQPGIGRLGVVDEQPTRQDHSKRVSMLRWLPAVL